MVPPVETGADPAYLSRFGIKPGVALPASVLVAGRYSIVSDDDPAENVAVVVPDGLPWLTVIVVYEHDTPPAEGHRGDVYASVCEACGFLAWTFDDGRSGLIPPPAHTLCAKCMARVGTPEGGPT